ncbi:sulfotransferase family protein [Dyella nitratireducens]|uniref:sulfotransferase family protein n=1 Tax=Dyella nitratireducens TaxID=1849580 RepID=UPI001667CDA1|nr:sulfotransferase [Dyella nitratireducens]
MSAKQNKGPIFVVGCPRSGTSILTWCLGQHANILPQEESGWLGEFAVSLGVQFKAGTLHGQRSQLIALGVDDAAFFQAFGDCTNAMILGHRFRQECISKDCSKRDPSQIHQAFNISRSIEEPKSRWVDGTPEYSYYITGLRKLFPDAKFVHIVRNVRCVVDSMLNFRMGNGRPLVKTEQQAYEYWLGTVQACIRAEHAYGPQVVHRLRYEDLVKRSEWAIRGVLDFLNEPYMDTCLQPLASRINSSNVPAGFKRCDPQTDVAVINHALQLNEQLQQENRSLPISGSALTQMNKDFSKRVAFMAELDIEYAAGQHKVAALTKRLNWCGVVLTANFLMASICFCTLWLTTWFTSLSQIALWLLTASASIGGYIVIRRAGLRNYGLRLLRQCHWRNGYSHGPSQAQVNSVLTQDLGVKKM